MVPNSLHGSCQQQAAPGGHSTKKFAKFVISVCGHACCRTAHVGSFSLVVGAHRFVDGRVMFYTQYVYLLPSAYTL